MPNYQNILVAVDGSDEAKKALKRAIDIAVERDAHLIITHVIDTRSFATIDQYQNNIVLKAENYGKELLENYEKDANNSGVKNITTVLEYGSPKVKIPKSLANEYEVDLIVSGATGLNTVERILIGSVSENISRNAPCDVLIVR